ncbi:hypothetical protein BC937DRAFT_86352 [Endogone sp. FLAS-F59071]|nr:hypothetical protein BC937DRAFT_86352 [Endogone sp. FLAS-F59071]|eukprot:RUS13096.1 hypothetical protein BC937DRAFT_86352 [Endogone sp. FLAS-F59071]
MEGSRPKSQRIQKQVKEKSKGEQEAKPKTKRAAIATQEKETKLQKTAAKRSRKVPNDDVIKELKETVATQDVDNHDSDTVP